MFRHPLRKRYVATHAAVALAFLCLFPAVGHGQEAQGVNVKFAFRLPAVETRFEQVSQSDIEKDASVELAKSCWTHFPYWTFQATAGDLPRLDAWLSLKNSTWSLNIALAHASGRKLKDKWSTVLYAPGDLDTGGLPKDRAWTAKIKATFEGLLEGESENEILKALQEFAPLGTQVARVPAQSTAVLPLEFAKYQVLSLSSFRIMCQWPGHGVVVLHSTGTGAPNDFTPETPKYKGIWVVHNKWEFGGHSEEISAHMNDIQGLKTLAFYLEELKSPPPQVSVAP